MILFLTLAAIWALVFGARDLAFGLLIFICGWAAMEAREAHRHTHALGCHLNAPGAAQYCDGWD